MVFQTSSDFIISFVSYCCIWSHSAISQQCHEYQTN